MLVRRIFTVRPASVAMKLLEAGRIEGVAGSIFPMLLRALTCREKDNRRCLPRPSVVVATGSSICRFNDCRKEKSKSSINWAPARLRQCW